MGLTVLRMRKPPLLVQKNRDHTFVPREKNGLNIMPLLPLVFLWYNILIFWARFVQCKDVIGIPPPTFSRPLGNDMWMEQLGIHTYESDC